MKAQLKQRLTKILEPMEMDELREVFDIWKQFYSLAERRLTLSFRPGETVSFKGRWGKIETGRVRKIHQKTVQVDVNGTLWTVGASLLIKI